MTANSKIENQNINDEKNSRDIAIANGRKVPISDTLREAIINDIKNGLSGADASRKYNVSSSSITRICQKAGVELGNSKFAPKKKKSGTKTTSKTTSTATATIEPVIKSEQQKRMDEIEKSAQKIGTLENNIITNPPVDNSLEKMFEKNNSAPMDKLEDLSHAIAALGLLVNNNIPSASLTYNLNGKLVKVKIENA